VLSVQKLIASEARVEELDHQLKRTQEVLAGQQLRLQEVCKPLRRSQLMSCLSLSIELVEGTVGVNRILLE
jgi:hypothetical protein